MGSRANNVTMTDEIGYSLVFPLKDEEENIPALLQHISLFLKELDGPAEVIFVDDGSTDRSVELLREYQGSDSRLILVELSRNFGHQIAITAGMDLARGKAVIVLDSDLQDPLAAAHDMIQVWKAGYEIVYGVRQARKDETLLRRFVPWVFYRILNRITEVAIPVDVGDFRLVDRKAVNAFREMRERNRFVRGMFAWIGFRSRGVPYVREGRPAGKSKYGWKKLLILAINGIFSFSSFPLKLSIGMGGLFIAFSVIVAILYAILILVGFYNWNWRASIVLLISFLGGMNLLMLGTLGLYVTRIYDEARARPLYIIRNLYRAE